MNVFPICSMMRPLACVSSMETAKQQLKCVPFLALMGTSDEVSIKYGAKYSTQQALRIPEAFC